MYEDTGFVNHRDVEWAPVLEEREVEKLVVDGEVVVGRGLVGGRGMDLLGTRADAWTTAGLCGEAVEDQRVGCRLGKGGEVKPGEGKWWQQTTRLELPVRETAQRLTLHLGAQRKGCRRRMPRQRKRELYVKFNLRKARGAK